MRESFISHNFQNKTLALIDQANDILAEYAAQGFTSMTLRQIYYQMVARDMIPNSLRSYKRLGSVLSDARDAGLISWARMQDPTRRISQLYHLEDFKDALLDSARSFRRDLWANQPWWVLVMVEKEALAGVVGSVCEDWDVPFTANRGYPSASHLWRIASDIQLKISEGKKVLVLHLGDLDPSGWDMTSDVVMRLALYARQAAGIVDLDEDDFTWPEHRDLVSIWENETIGDESSEELLIKRVALNMDQVEQYDPPPNPAKISDSRAGFYIDKFGRSSWELDALAPPVFKELLEAEIKGVLDQDQYNEDKQLAADDKDALFTLATNFNPDDVMTMATKCDREDLAEWLESLDLD